ncbi:G-type lectin S-receptor-like serine/threonine-protein kinase At4g27290 [Syzygium oleosum]|uniref:G-type lectin S-receptor-like serine/threonine-protein kinase At4g27290 n=1 Tax=Syzygium oleosum TaxID=219896 RepID=UPI0024BA33CF|nr:G-type lectin S-receptor-like serine/threonine-protein kinase At4g27290 [Syzygium oleosum]
MALEKLTYSPFFYSIYVMFVLNFSIVSDTISSSQSIKDGEKLVSSGQSFELGFFSRENSKYRYLGIWYKISPEKVVWVANGNNPLTDSDGVLTFSQERNLVVVNRSKSVMWSSNSSRVLRNPVAQLLDSGKLVVSENNSSRSGEYSWQSFDYPTDTLLAGMRIGWSLKTGLEWHLTSWKSTIDPSSGDYTYGIKVNELPQFEVLKRGSTKTFRTGPWNGFYFTGSPVTENSIHSPVNKKILLTITVASVICGLLIAGIALSVMRKSRIRRRGLQSQKEDIDLPLFDFSTIADATGHFSQTNMIGAGGFGSVYKGNLSTGQEIAVKRLSRSSRQGLEEFMNEVLLIARLQHRNLVGLLGYCIEGEERMLIYEYMPNKSLAYFIFDY